MSLSHWSVVQLSMASPGMGDETKVGISSCTSQNHNSRNVLPGRARFFLVPGALPCVMTAAGYLSIVLTWLKGHRRRRAFRDLNPAIQ